MLREGDKLPAISVEDDVGKRVKVRDLLDDRLVLYFYPKDDTPGCTNEASQFRDLLSQFKRKKVRVAGVSRDSVASHRAFKKKYSLTFPLLSDVDSALCDAFGVIVEKVNYGKKYKGIQRSTFLIDAKGKIAKVWPKVTADGHAQEVLEYLKAPPERDA
ncbi:MAG: thioredoxin-dependent thiol peroxidase [Candidatus Tyrphobacter sp.]